MQISRHFRNLASLRLQTKLPWLTGCGLRGNGTDYDNYKGKGTITADGRRVG